MCNVMIINGPNLNLLGQRETNLYGKKTLENIKEDCLSIAAKLKFSIDFYQTSSESQIIDWIHSSAENHNGLIINAAGYAHTSIAIMDALLILNIPIVEVHLSNTAKREQFRQHSYIAKAAQGSIGGFGGYGYTLALYAIHNILTYPFRNVAKRQYPVSCEKDLSS